MKLTLTIAWLFLAFQTAAFATGVTESVLLSFNEEKILALGETFHAQDGVTTAAFDILVAAAEDADWIGLEKSSDQQAAIDGFLTTDQPAPPEWSREFSSFLTRIKARNKVRVEHGRNAIRVLALDLPIAGFSSERDWFFQRDPHMFETLRQATGDFTGRGLLYMGMAHISKVPFRLPRVALEKMGLDRPTDLKTFGSMLEQTAKLSGQIVRVALHSDSPWLERWAYLPPDYNRFYRFMSAQTTGRLIATGTAEFLKQQSGKTESFPAPLRGNMDYLINLPYRRKFVVDCQRALANPALVWRGAWLRILDLKAKLTK